MSELTVDHLANLYRRYAEPLGEVRAAQRDFLRARRGALTPQLDDLEAEISYLLVREHQPTAMAEIGTLHGWSTTWLLSALRDNGFGELRSFDLMDNAARNVPDGLAAGRWSFHKGDIRSQPDLLPEKIDYLFIDAAHNGRFAQWYIDTVFPRLASGVPVSVHDVFHQSYALPFTEGRVVLRWLAERRAPFLTPSRARARHVNEALWAVKRELGLDEPVHTGRDNPMVFFRMP
ncbi:class I SAM-dependent methyltransferase [Halostreptopolyspora alba]|uniref:Class I SAM-dependent methyltransferase n=1 Tax=Halostreptopolyspora alba TaxID=2487137 RepID=A0A3N0EEW4_9ACTN|nr:class I SAM-dependent methyltransferase [Nocardiopsaceae bacterium YIM 96095]